VHGFFANTKADRQSASSARQIRPKDGTLDGNSPVIAIVIMM
jgi:hypothetical protein